MYPLQIRGTITILLRRVPPPTPCHPTQKGEKIQATNECFQKASFLYSWALAQEIKFPWQKTEFCSYHLALQWHKRFC